MATTTAKELAVQLGTDGRTVRKYLRSVTPKDDQPGKGARWSIENKKVASLKKGFSKWDEDRKAAEAARKDATPADLPEDDEVLDPA